MSVLTKYTGFISNFKNIRSLLSTFFVRVARALLRPSSLKLGGVGINDCEDRRIFSDLGKIYYIRALILRQSKLNEYIIIDSKLGDDHRT